MSRISTEESVGLLDPRGDGVASGCGQLVDAAPPAAGFDLLVEIW
jgi:hypothetical protein